MYRNNPYLTHDPSPIQSDRFNISSSDDRIYFNVVIPSTADPKLASPAIFQQEYNQPLIMDPSQYYLSMVRFTIPTQDIPIFIAQIQPFPNTNINNTIYSVTLTWNGFSSGIVYVQYVTQNPNSLVIPLSVSNPNAEKSLYYYVYTYTAFLDMINTAFQTAFDALNVASGNTLPSGSQAPYLQYEIFNDRISIVAQRANYDPNLSTPFKIFVNYFLFTFLDGLPFNFFGTDLSSGQDVQLVIYNHKNNWYNPSWLAPSSPGLYYIMTQEYNTLADWNFFKSLQIVSNLLPIRPEYVPVPSTVDQSIVNSQSILKDFEPLIELGPEARTTVQYQLNGPYQLINLNSNVPLTKVDISIYWTDQFGNKYLLSIPFNQVVTIKMVFIKKSTYIGY